MADHSHLIGGVPAAPKSTDTMAGTNPATVLVDVDEDMAVMQEETFRSVAPVQPMPSFGAALEAANLGPSGLAASVLTSSQPHAQRALAGAAAGHRQDRRRVGRRLRRLRGAAQVLGARLRVPPELLDEVTTTTVIHYGARPPSARP